MQLIAHFVLTKWIRMAQNESELLHLMFDLQ